MHHYHDVHDRFPPAVVYGDLGEPLYSWRVLILPYLEQQELYEEFHKDEPWDSPHNLQLLARMPGNYRAPGSKTRLAPPDHTFLHVFTGKGTAFEDPTGEQLRTFTDDTLKTILIVEGGEPVPWTKPEGIAYSPNQSLPFLATIFTGGFRVVTVVGQPMFVSKRVQESQLRAAITRNGGEQLVHDWQICPNR